jgi:hypothetical protein
LERLLPHIDLLSRELTVLSPAKIILLGTHSQELFTEYFPKEATRARVVPHFGYFRKVPAEKKDDWKEQFREKLRRALV